MKTFETLYFVPVSLDKDKTVPYKADRDLLRRVVVSLESGREVDLDTLLQPELSPVPLSIATLDRCPRLASSKSDLGKIFTAFVVSHVSNKCTRVDVVFDRCLHDSIKGVTRAKRKTGKHKGIRRDVESREQRISYWERFTVVE